MCCLSEIEKVERINARKSRKDIFLTEFYITTNLINEEFIHNISSILKIMAKDDSNVWPGRSYWQKKMPKWFLSNFHDPFTEKELENYINLNYNEKKKLDDDWDLDGWVYWLEPKNRAWYLWSHEIVTKSAVIITVCSKDTPFLSRSFDFLMKCCGAKEIDEMSCNYNENWGKDLP